MFAHELLDIFHKQLSLDETMVLLNELISKTSIDEACLVMKRHFNSYEQCVRVDNMDPKPGEILDGLTKICSMHLSMVPCLVENLIDWYLDINMYRMTEELTQQVTGFLCNFLLTNDCLDEMVQSLFELIRQKTRVKTKVFELLGPILGRNKQYRDQAEDLFRFEWEWEHTLPLANVFKFLEINYLDKVVQKFLKQIRNAQQDDVSILVYHVLFMASKMDKRSKSRIYPELLKPFEFVESNTLMHISLALQDVNIAKDLFLLTKKLKKQSLNQFSLCLSLCVARKKPYRDPILKHLKHLLNKNQKLKNETKEMKWITKQPWTILDQDKLFENVLKSSYVVQILDVLVELCLLLLKEPQLNTFPQKVIVEGLFVSLKQNTKSPSLASNVLIQVFKSHEVIRDLIVDLLCQKINSQSAGLENYLFVLESLVEYPIQIKSLLDQVQHLPKDQGQYLLLLLCKVASTNMEFREQMILFLLKGTADKRPQMRQTIVRGIVCLCSLCHTIDRDLEGMVDRCFGLDANCKVVLYQEIIQSSRLCFFKGLILNHFSKFTKNMQICFDDCFKESEIVEPMHYLIKLVHLFGYNIQIFKHQFKNIQMFGVDHAPVFGSGDLHNLSRASMAIFCAEAMASCLKDKEMYESYLNFVDFVKNNTDKKTKLCFLDQTIMSLDSALDLKAMRQISECLKYEQSSKAYDVVFDHLKKENMADKKEMMFASQSVKFLNSEASLDVFLDLVLFGYFKEATIVSKCLMENSRKKLLHLIQNDTQIDDPILVKHLFQILFKHSDLKLEILGQVSRNLLLQWGRVATYSDTQEQAEGWMILSCHPKNKISVTQVLLKHMDYILQQIQYCLSEYSEECMEFEQSLFKRCLFVLDAIDVLSKSKMESEATDVFLRTLALCFQTMNMVVVFFEKRSEFDDLFFDVIQLSSQLHEAVAYFQLAMDNQAPKVLRERRTQKKYESANSKVHKSSKTQAKLMSALVMQSELLDVSIIKVSKKHRCVLKHIRRSIVRDFKFEKQHLGESKKRKSD